MSDDWRTPPTKTKYHMLWAGEWRPVLQMFDASNTPTTLAVRAGRAVLYVSHGRAIVVAVHPADILEDEDYRTSVWEMDH